MKKKFHTRSWKNVLILVLMDDALVLAKSKRAAERRFVLILVLMDDALVPQANENIQ